VGSLAFAAGKAVLDGTFVEDGLLHPHQRVMHHLIGQEIEGETAAIHVAARKMNSAAMFALRITDGRPTQHAAP
jgi:hypothetical protein